MRKIRCCACEKDVIARLTNGAEIYPRRLDLCGVPFWVCDACGNYVGCHYKTKNKTEPLGCIPTPEIKSARQHIHKLLDSMWSSPISRRELYKKISKEIGRSYHTASITSIEEARSIYRIIKKLKLDCSIRVHSGNK